VTIVSNSLENGVGLGNNGPLLFGDVILVHIDVVAVGVQAPVEYERCVHERAGVDEGASLLDLHTLYIEYEAAVEDLEGECRFATENQNFVFSDLVSEAHVRRHPTSLVDKRAGDLLPHIPRNIVALNSVYDLLLVNSAAESKDVVVLEGAEGDSSAWHLERINFFPLVLLGIVLFTVPIHYIIHKCAHDVNEAVHAANRVVCVRLVHVGHANECGEDFVVAEARIQVHVVVLDVTTCQVNGSRLSRDRP